MSTNNPADDEKPAELTDDTAQQDTEAAETTPLEEAAKPASITPPEKSRAPNKLQKFWAAYKSNKKLAIPLTAAVLAVLMSGIPVTRYAVAGLFIKRDVHIKIADIQTAIPISGVEVSAGGKSAKTDAEGNATITGVKVGKTKLVATKKYYKDYSSDITVTLKKKNGRGEIKLEATGRQVPVQVINKITGKGLAGATVKAADTEVQTDKNGAATLVVPADKTTLSGTVTAEGFNDQKADIKVSQSAIKENTFSLSPIGKLYFLSKKSGRIDVVKTDLDGANRQTVLAGTGKEEDTNTILLASRDWKFLALLSRRDGDRAKMYLIDTGNDKLTEIDSGDAIFSPVGWHDHFFVYKVSRNNVGYWQPRREALKTYNADNLQLTVADETNAEGSNDNEYAAENMGNVYILKDKLVYSKRWDASYYGAYRLSGKRTAIYSIKSNGTSKQVIKDLDAASRAYITDILFKPDEIYYSVNANSSTTYYEYENGTFEETKEFGDDSFYNFYPTYLVSPSAHKTFWYEPRDGKNTLFIGTQTGESPEEIASLSEYIPYGWYTDDYLLVSKDGSELYILPAGGADEKGQTIKVTDYHKPARSFQGYGYGYGGN